MYCVRQDRPVWSRRWIVTAGVHGLALPALLCVIGLGGCSRSATPDTPTLRLVDQFHAESVTNSPTRPLRPGRLVGFRQGRRQTRYQRKDPCWAGKSARRERFESRRRPLTGRTTTDFPLIYAPVPQSIDPDDDFHSIDVRDTLERGRGTGCHPLQRRRTEFQPHHQAEPRLAAALIAKVAAGGGLSNAGDHLHAPRHDGRQERAHPAGQRQRRHLRDRVRARGLAKRTPRDGAHRLGWQGPRRDLSRNDRVALARSLLDRPRHSRATPGST